MIILSDSLARRADEGCLKVAASLARRIKEADCDVQLISYGDRECDSDLHLRLNSLFLNWNLVRLLRRKKDSVLYIPFASNTLATMLRLWVLRLCNGGRVRVLFALRHPMGKLTKWLLKHSGAEVIVLSRASFDAYHRIVGDRVTYLRAGVDTAKFAPVDEQAKLRLRQEYGIAQDKRVVLHVGHLREGRNVGALCDLDPQNLGVLVLSSETKADRDLSLQQKLEQAPNVMIIDRYIANIQHIYQLADVYLFPVLAEGACIDLPLSVLEAAACGIPVVTTPYGELEALQGREGFLYPDMKDAKAFNAAIREAASWADHRSRAVAMEYDWDRAVEKLTKEGRVCE